MPRTTASAAHGGFTLTELLVVIVIIALLASILMPSLLSARIQMLRTKCGNNAAEIAKACQTYAMDSTMNRGGHGNALPSGTTTSWTDLSNGHIKGLGLLYQRQYVGREYFICPEAEIKLDHQPLPQDHDPVADGYYFKQTEAETNLSYAYLIQFYTDGASTIESTCLGAKELSSNKYMDGTMIIIADDSPQIKLGTAGGTGEPAETNSANHKGEGQNIARLGGSVDWVTSPRVEDPDGGAGAKDNIYGLGDTNTVGGLRNSLGDVFVGP
jgi:prepilin-type N-terminal cleavage/methylation domain-containing protein